MTKFTKIIIVCALTAVNASCSQILQTIDLKINTQDLATQEEFSVSEKTLTLEEARNQNKSSYNRQVLQNGRGGNARPITEKEALASKFPENKPLTDYKIGIGDTLRFSRLIENNRYLSEIDTQWPEQIEASDYKLGVGDTLTLTLIQEVNSDSQVTPNTGDGSQNLIINNSQTNDSTIVSTGRIGSDGSVLFLEIGRLEANGKSLNELRSEVRNILIRNGISPRFQLEIVEFNSQKAYLTVNEASQVIILKNQEITIRDILTSASVGFQPGVITRIKLQRGSKEYIMSLREVFSENARSIVVKNRDHIFVEDSSANILSTNSTVDHEGNVVFEGVGRIKAAGISLSNLRGKIEKLIQKLPDSKNAFQIEITEFSSKKALVTIPGKSGRVITITETPVTIDEVLTESDAGIEVNSITRISLQRQDKNFTFTLDDLLDPKNPKIYVQEDDKFTIEVLPYKQNKVFILGGVEPQIFNINPALRETLADVLFTKGGVLSSPSAKRSEVYLLRGKRPVVAYHLDAQSPTRLIVANALELRPNDILYVAEQPIISFNRTLTTIVPLRILLRDIQDENIP